MVEILYFIFLWFLKVFYSIYIFLQFSIVLHCFLVSIATIENYTQFKNINNNNFYTSEN